MDTLLFTSRVHRHCACRGGGRGREGEEEGGGGRGGREGRREGGGGGGGRGRREGEGRGEQYAFAHIMVHLYITHSAALCVCNQMQK